MSFFLCVLANTKNHFGLVADKQYMLHTTVIKMIETFVMTREIYEGVDLI